MANEDPISNSIYNRHNKKNTIAILLTNKTEYIRDRTNDSNHHLTAKSFYSDENQNPIIDYNVIKISPTSSSLTLILIHNQSQSQQQQQQQEEEITTISTISNDNNINNHQMVNGPTLINPDVFLAFTLIIFYAMFVLFILIIVIRIIITICTTRTSVKMSNSLDDTFSDQESSSGRTRTYSQGTATMENLKNKHHRHRIIINQEMTSFVIGDIGDRTNSPSMIECITTTCDDPKS